MSTFPTPLRQWQQEAFDKFRRSGRKKNFVANVAPGGGKTIFALAVAHWHVRKTRWGENKVVVVVHTANLRTQWANQAATVGLTLLTDWKGELPRLADGIVVTYQQIAYDPQSFYKALSSNDLAIFDEIHHVADDNNWGVTCGMAFKRVYKRLLLSGTPFRHDESKITFVPYKKNTAQVDYSYGYDQALADGLVCPVFFPTFEAHTKWRLNGTEYDVILEDDLSYDVSGKSLRAALSPRGQYMQSVLQAAHKRLLSLRKTHPQAKGLITAIDQKHARSIRSLMRKLTDSAVPIAISDNVSSHETIERFKQDDNTWLVSVRMVSEGVDIPDLRVGVYATNIQTELFFRQFVGRFVRLAPDLEEQSVYVYIPRHKALLAHAKVIQEERTHVLSSAIESDENSANSIQRKASVHFDVDVLETAGIAQSVLSPGMEFTQEELQRAEMVRSAAGMGHLPVEVVAKILRVSNKETIA